MPTKTYKALANITLSSSAASVTFGSIPSTYRDLVLIASVRSAASGTGDVMRVRINSDTSSSNYPRIGMYGTGSTTGSFSATTDPGLILQSTAAGSASNTFDINIVQIMDYSATDKHKTVLIRQSEATTTVVVAQAARWANTAAITSLNIVTDGGDNIASGSSFALYGIES